MTTSSSTIFLLSFFLISFLGAESRTFRFTGAEDRDYSNPANWLPAYPGDDIAEGDLLVVERDAIFLGEQLRVLGSLRVEEAATLRMNRSKLILGISGSIDLRGALVVKELQSFGQLLCHRNSSLAGEQCLLEASSQSMMLAGSAMWIDGDLKLLGRADVGAKLVIGGTFWQEGELTVGAAGHVEWQDAWLMESGASMYYHLHARIGGEAQGS